MKRLQSAIFALMLPFPLAFYAQAQTPQPPPPPKSFSSSTGTNHLEGLDVDFLASELETLKTKEFVADALEIAKRNPDLANILLQSLVFTHLMELTRWTKAAALSAYAKTAPDPQVAEAISYCYVQNMKSLDALKTCIDNLNSTVDARTRATFVQEQLGFQSESLYKKVIGDDPNRKLVRAYAFEYHLDSAGNYRVDSTNLPSTLLQRFTALRPGIQAKLGTTPACDSGTVPPSVSLSTTGSNLIAQTLSVDTEVYLEAMEESAMCGELADALTLQALQGEVEKALEKLTSARGTTGLHETEFSRLTYERDALQRNWAEWNGLPWVKTAQYDALRERVARRLEDRYRRAGEMLGR